MKLYVYLAAAMLIAGLLGYGVHIVRKASRAEAAEEALQAAQEQYAADIGRLSKAAESNRAIAVELASLRSEQATASRAFHEELSKRNITREVRYVTQEGEQVVCTQRDPERYRSLFNSAVTGTANP